MIAGTVDFFDDAKGIGFIQTDAILRSRVWTMSLRV